MSLINKDQLNVIEGNLLLPTEPSPVTSINQNSFSPFLLVCDHAGCIIPTKLGNLGLQEKDRYRHVVWDIGVQKVGQKLSVLLDTAFIFQTYSRLVIDCNRGIDNPTLIAEKSDDILIPGNQNLTTAQKGMRIQEIYKPYHQTIADLIDERLKINMQTIFISLHSFTPEMQDGFQRPWYAGVLHGRNNQFSVVFKELLEKNYHFPVGDNQPYALTEKNDYTVPTHAYKNGLPYLELEIRQDLITTEEQQYEWAERLSLLLPMALQEYESICS